MPQPGLLNISYDTTLTTAVDQNSDDGEAMTHDDDCECKLTKQSYGYEVSRHRYNDGAMRQRHGVNGVTMRQLYGVGTGENNYCDCEDIRQNYDVEAVTHSYCVNNNITNKSYVDYEIRSESGGDGGGEIIYNSGDSEAIRQRDDNGKVITLSRQGDGGATTNCYGEAKRQSDGREMRYYSCDEKATNQSYGNCEFLRPSDEDGGGDGIASGSCGDGDNDGATRRRYGDVGGDDGIASGSCGDGDNDGATRRRYGDVGGDNGTMRRSYGNGEGDNDGARRGSYYGGGGGKLLLFLVFLLTTPPLAATSIPTIRKDGSTHIAAAGESELPHPCTTCPYFLPTPTDITTPVGVPANLTCGIRQIGDRKVSWIRRKDLHVLTTGNFTYTSDQRFRALHLPGSPFWTLQVNGPTVGDAGVYECQISTQPKISRRFRLRVIVPLAAISGTREIFMKAGSDINITCLVQGAVRGAPVTWYHVLPSSLRDSNRARGGTDVVNTGTRGGVQLVTDKNGGSSWLLVHHATWRDAGNYTCAPAHARPASIAVHVLDEETPAELHHDAVPSKGSQPPLAPLVLSFLCSLLSLLAREGWGPGRWVNMLLGVYCISIIIIIQSLPSLDLFTKIDTNMYSYIDTNNSSIASNIPKRENILPT